jgi:cytochrome c-type biogenesis protein CcmH/NrfG
MSKVIDNLQTLLARKRKLIIICFVLIIGVLTFFNLSLYMNKTNLPSKVLASKDQNNVLIWKEFLKSHPDYIEGWIELSKIEFDKGNKSEAYEAYVKAWKINPNSQEVIQLGSKLFGSNN